MCLSVLLRVLIILVTICQSSIQTESRNALIKVERSRRQTNECEPLRSIGLDIKCEFGGAEVPCDKPMKPGTSATLKCKKNYRFEYVPDSTNLKCQNNGKWDFPLYYCNPECGISIDPEKHATLIIDGSPTYQGEFPWLTALYLLSQSSNKWDQICAGTLITRQIVLSAAHCVMLNDGPVTPQRLKVGFGKYYRDYYKNEKHSIIVDVVDIKVQDNYDGADTWYVLDIALIKLAENVRLTPFIMPACVDWSSRVPINSGELGHVAGWGRTRNNEPSEVALSAVLKYIKNNECKNNISVSYRQYVTYDKFCAISLNGSQVHKGDSGGGLTFVKDEQHFVFGVVSSKVSQETYFSLFTDVSNAVHQKWMIYHKDYWEGKQSTNVNSLVGKSCTLPGPQQNRQFTKNGCSGYLSTCIWNPGETVPHLQEVAVSCLPDLNLLEISKCQDGVWYPSIPQCLPCGKSNLRHRFKRTLGGNYAELGNFPWHAGVYHKNGGGWKYVCGGTLLSARIVLTAAHCVARRCTGCKPLPMDTQDVMIVLGKAFREWSVSGIVEQKKEVKSIQIHDRYLGDTLLYAQDIAMVVLKSDVRISSFIMPACVDFRKRYSNQLLEDKSLQGYVPGWGNTVECGSPSDGPCNKPSDKLRYSRTNILGYDECYKTTQGIKPLAFNRLSEDKICGGNGTVSVLQAGDGGGGLTYVFNGLHYVFGIGGVKLKLEIGGELFYSFSTFTNVTYYLEWMGRLH